MKHGRISTAAAPITQIDLSVLDALARVRHLPHVHAPDGGIERLMRMRGRKFALSLTRAAVPTDLADELSRADAGAGEALDALPWVAAYPVFGAWGSLLVETGPCPRCGGAHVFGLGGHTMRRRPFCPRAFVRDDAPAEVRLRIVLDAPPPWLAAEFDRPREDLSVAVDMLARRPLWCEQLEEVLDLVAPAGIVLDEERKHLATGLRPRHARRRAIGEVLAPTAPDLTRRLRGTTLGLNHVWRGVSNALPVASERDADAMAALKRRLFGLLRDAWAVRVPAGGAPHA